VKSSDREQGDSNESNGVKQLHALCCEQLVKLPKVADYQVQISLRIVLKENIGLYEQAKSNAILPRMLSTPRSKSGPATHARNAPHDLQSRP
jgi:hypothetical protein